jgi:hypothetical protein
MQFENTPTLSARVSNSQVDLKSDWAPEVYDLSSGFPPQSQRLQLFLVSYPEPVVSIRCSENIDIKINNLPTLITGEITTSNQWPIFFLTPQVRQALT